MEALKLFFLSISIGVVIYLITLWSERYKTRSERSQTSSMSPRSNEDSMISALGQVERELSNTLSGEGTTGGCADDGGDACAYCSDACLGSEHLPKVTTQIVYYDDEELDTLAHRSVESYTDTETQKLREIAETLLEEDRPGWLKSLSMRGILLPPDILRIVAP
jgi:hypothetical protein